MPQRAGELPPRDTPLELAVHLLPRNREDSLPPCCYCPRCHFTHLHTVSKSSWSMNEKNLALHYLGVFLLCGDYAAVGVQVKEVGRVMLNLATHFLSNSS